MAARTLAVTWLMALSFISLLRLEAEAQKASNPSMPPFSKAVDGKLGVPYLVGPRSFVIGTNETLDVGIRRLVTLTGVKTAVSFGAKRETFVAGRGKKLVIFYSTIKNHAKSPISVGSSSVFGLRIYESGYKAGDVKYLGAVHASLGVLDQSLKNGESTDVISIYEFPANSPSLKVGIYFHTYQSEKTKRFDLSNLAQSTGSVFASDPLNYAPTADTKVGARFDLDDLEFTVLGCDPIRDGGQRVRVEVRNPNPKPGRWGWQYAKAVLKAEDGSETPNYPEFYVEPEFTEWRNEIAPEKPVRGEYRFYPSKPFIPKTFTLKMNSTERAVTVRLSGQ